MDKRKKCTRKRCVVCGSIVEETYGLTRNRSFVCGDCLMKYKPLELSRLIEEHKEGMNSNAKMSKMQE